MNLILRKLPGMYKSTSEYTYELSFVESGPGLRPLDSLRIHGDEALHTVLTEQLDQSPSDAAGILARLNASSNSTVDVLPNLRIQGAAVGAAEVPLLCRNIELARRAQ